MATRSALVNTKLAYRDIYAARYHRAPTEASEMLQDCRCWPLRGITERAHQVTHGALEQSRPGRH